MRNPGKALGASRFAERRPGDDENMARQLLYAVQGMETGILEKTGEVAVQATQLIDPAGFLETNPMLWILIGMALACVLWGRRVSRVKF